MATIQTTRSGKYKVIVGVVGPDGKKISTGKVFTKKRDANAWGVETEARIKEDDNHFTEKGSLDELVHRYIKNPSLVEKTQLPLNLTARYLTYLAW